MFLDVLDDERLGDLRGGDELACEQDRAFEADGAARAGLGRDEADLAARRERDRARRHDRAHVVGRAQLAGQVGRLAREVRLPGSPVDAHHRVEHADLRVDVAALLHQLEALGAEVRCACVLVGLVGQQRRVVQQRAADQHVVRRHRRERALVELQRVVVAARPRRLGGASDRDQDVRVIRGDEQSAFRGGLEPLLQTRRELGLARDHRSGERVRDRRQRLQHRRRVLGKRRQQLGVDQDRPVQDDVGIHRHRRVDLVQDEQLQLLERGEREPVLLVLEMRLGLQEEVVDRLLGLALGRRDDVVASARRADGGDVVRVPALLHVAGYGHGVAPAVGVCEVVRDLVEL